MKYLLPCDCGQSVQIEASQAGQDVVCECGKTLAVPKLRKIRHLKQVLDDVPESDGGPWTLARGMVFSCGVLILLIAGGMAIYYYQQGAGVQGTAQPDLDGYLDEEDYVQRLDAKSPHEVFTQDWIAVNRRPWSHQEPKWVGLREEANKHYSKSRMFGLAGLIGAIAAIGAALMPRGK